MLKASDSLHRYNRQFTRVHSSPYVSVKPNVSRTAVWRHVHANFLAMSKKHVKSCCKKWEKNCLASGGNFYHVSSLRSQEGMSRWKCRIPQKVVIYFAIQNQKDDQKLTRAKPNSLWPTSQGRQVQLRTEEKRQKVFRVFVSAAS